MTNKNHHVIDAPIANRCSDAKDVCRSRRRGNRGITPGVCDGTGCAVKPEVYRAAVKQHSESKETWNINARGGDADGKECGDMAYSELIKNFNRIREYMRGFYVYGFKSRDEYNGKSARSYDNERRRIESWLGEYMRFRQTPDGKNVFLSIDSRSTCHNPLYKAFKTKSFTDGDITLHFIIFDILFSPEIEMTLNEITESIDGYLLSFDSPRMFDVSTVRKKLNEYISEGIIEAKKRGRTMFYRRASDCDFGGTDMLNFFSEVAPCGVIGSYLLDKKNCSENFFCFKHHYITGATDSEIVYMLFLAMSEKRFVMLESLNRRRKTVNSDNVVPLKIMIGVQSGRQYLMAYSPRFNRFSSYRTDNILSVKQGEKSERFDELRTELDALLPKMWGVSAKNTSGNKTEHVEFTVKYSVGESYIHRRLEREKRCGTVEKLADNMSKFSADVFDAWELLPWIRTFICRIIDISFSNKELEKRFYDDLHEMYALYGLVEGAEQ